MLTYRLLHFRDNIPDIHIKLIGRDKELIKPYLQLFSKFGTAEEKKIYDEEIANTFTKFLEIKNDKKHSTIEYALIPLILILMEESKARNPIKFSDLWDLLQCHVKGELNKSKPNEYNTEDYGTIYRNTISSTLEKLGVKTKRQNTFVKLIFDKKKIKKTSSQYGIIVQDRINDYVSECGERSERSLESYTKESSIEADNTSKFSTETSPVSTNNTNISTKDDANRDLSSTSNNNDEKEPSDNVHSVHHIHHTDKVLKPNLYRIGNSDIIGCRNCKMKGDRWFMINHPCSGSLSEE